MQLMLSDYSVSTWKATADMALSGNAKLVGGYVERLEAAFLDHRAARLYYERDPDFLNPGWNNYPEEPCHCRPKEFYREKAREELERIKMRPCDSSAYSQGD